MSSILRQLEEEQDKVEADRGYNWEQGFERSWENIAEDEHGLLRPVETAQRQRQKRSRYLQAPRAVQKGMIRYLYLILDLSRGLEDNDFKPNRQTAVLNLAEEFITNYFDQNPLSNLGIIVTRNGKAEKLTDLSGNPKRQVEALKANFSLGGDPSIQNALELARISLKVIPAYGNCEIVMVYGSLSTSDPGDIHTTIDALKAEKVRCSVVGLGAELYILHKVTKETGGAYHVAQDRDHLHEIMKGFLVPPPKASKSAVTFASLVQMGFPQKRVEKNPSLCICHQEFKTVGYLCPRCWSRVCELPTSCSICNLPLVSSPQLARSYHHLFPVDFFVEKSSKERETCFSCLRIIADGDVRASCPTCSHTFCVDCDIFIHESLHNCPGCQERM